MLKDHHVHVFIKDEENDILSLNFLEKNQNNLQYMSASLDCQLFKGLTLYFSVSSLSGDRVLLRFSSRTCAKIFYYSGFQTKTKRSENY